MTKEAMLKREAAGYMKTLDLTPAEREEILVWVKDGNSVYDNPWCMAEENGRQMDYIFAVRFENDLRQSINLHD